MAIKDRIKEARQRKNFTQEQLASRIGIAKSTLAGYETGIREPSIEIIGKIMYVLDIDANYLWQDEGNFPLQVSYNEMEHIKKYRSLDDPGRSHIDTVLDWEVKRSSQLLDTQGQLRQSQSQVDSLKLQLSHERTVSRFFAYYGRVAAAGTSVEFSDIAAGVRAYPENEINKQADYVIGVNGDSMEPEYFDGDVVYVQKTDHIEIGDIGIFQRGNSIYIKKVGENGLISLNPDYPPLMADGDRIVVLGKVLGKAEEI